MKRNIIQALCVVMLFNSVVMRADLSDSDRQYVREISNNSLEELFAGVGSSLSDKTIRYTTAMTVLRELSAMADTPGDKALVRAAEKNVEEQYRTLLTRDAQRIVDTELSNQGKSLSQEDRERIDNLIRLAGQDVNALLKSPETSFEATARVNKLLSQLESLNDAKLAAADRLLIERGRSAINRASEQWQQQYETSANAPAQAIEEESPVPPAPELSPAPGLETDESMIAPPMESEPPMAPPLEESAPLVKAPKISPREAALERVSEMMRTLPQQEGREALLEQIRQGRKLRPGSEGRAMRERQAEARVARETSGRGVEQTKSFNADLAEALRRKFKNAEPEEIEVTDVDENWD